MYLTTELPTAILPSLCESPIQIDANDAVVKFCPIEKPTCVAGILVGKILDEAKSTLLVCLFVDSHNDTFDFTHP